MEKDELAVLIPSETVRKYALETGWNFTDKQKAAILYHQDQPESEIRKALYVLRDTTEDADLKRQLTEYLEREEKAFELFRENRERNYVYIMAYGDDGGETGYFLDLELAYRYGTDTKYPFVIEKHLLASEKILDKFEDGIYQDYVEAIIRFDANGKLEYFSSEELPPADWTADDGWDERFENMFYEVPNPFDRGDIVRKAGSEAYGIVEDSQEDWRKQLERYRSRKPESGLDDTDVEVRVAFPDEDGDFYHEHINPIFLERYEPENNADSECVARDILLIQASEMCRGNGALEDWSYFTEQYSRAVKAEKN